MKLLTREQKYRQKLLDLQSRKLIDDLNNAREVKRIIELLDNNQQWVQRLAKATKMDDDDANLIAILDNQLFEMKDLLVAHERKLQAYKQAAQIFKIKLDRVLASKDDLQKELDAIKEFDDGIFAIKLGKKQRVSEYEEGKSEVNSEKLPEYEESPSKMTLKNKVGDALFDITLPSEEDDIADEKTVEEVIQLSEDHKIEEVLKDRYSEEFSVSSLEYSEVNKPVTIDKHPDGRDDLTVINGIGSKFEALLNANGITTISQIAQWTKKEVKVRDARLVFRGRIKRERWVEQARDILSRARTSSPE